MLSRKKWRRGARKSAKRICRRLRHKLRRSQNPLSCHSEERKRRGTWVFCSSRAEPRSLASLVMTSNFFSDFFSQLVSTARLRTRQICSVLEVILQNPRGQRGIHRSAIRLARTDG